MLEDIGDVDTKSTFLPWQNMAEGKTVQSTGEDTVCPWQEDSHPLFLPFPCPYAHGELSTLPLSGFPWREDSQSFPIVAQYARARCKMVLCQQGARNGRKSDKRCGSHGAAARPSHYA